MKIIFALFFILISFKLAAGEKNYYELGAAISVGSFQHESQEFKGMSLSVTGTDFVGNYFLRPDHALLAGLEAYFSLSRLALTGIRFGNKWYFMGAPKTDLISPLMNVASYKKYSPFVGAEIRRYTYYLSESFAENNNLEHSGNFYNFNFLLGGDYIIRENLKLTGSISRTLISVAATDGRIKMAGTLLQLGVLFNY